MATQLQQQQLGDRVVHMRNCHYSELLPILPKSGGFFDVFV